ncbi:hypothetical protein V9T40_005432 [Parthenolecanium corni]|uniref:Uncharacterized protein n=1 Tax=Parthenolecanium corni TaxID=536013 RepID=A0AAN9Y4R7_9HEMI
MLLTCYGQHKPIRTSRELDDYYETFFLTSGSSPTQMYLFKRITTAKTREIVLLGKHSAKQDPRLTEGVTISPVEVKRDGYLSTVETRNFDLAEIEMIYALDVIDVISQPDAFEDPLSILDRGSLLTLCMSLFREIAALHHAALIDINGMFEAEEAEIRVLRRVAFEYEVSLEPHQQRMCSCLLKHISGRNIYNIILCDEEMDIHKQIAACQNLFGLFLYRFNWNAHLNIRAFATLQGREQRACTVQTIQWKVIGGPTNWSPMLLTCYGQHKPIRTSRELDDYYETFFLTSGSSPTQMYLFKRITTAKTREIVLLGKHSAKQDPRLTEGVTISPVEVKRDGYLSTVETRNFDLAEIEMIYALDVIDVISQPDAFEDPLSILDRGSLLTLCMSLFREIAALHHAALIDINGMFEAEEAEIRVLRRVAFEYEVSLEPHQQRMCSCLLKHISGRNIYNIILCDEEMDIHKQIAACQNLFGLFLYRFNWNAHLNIRAFATLQGREQRACTVQTIQWKVIGGPTNWSPMLLTCYGQHKPIRTSRKLDDYYETFFLTSGSSPTQMYLFKRITTAKTREIVLLGKHSAKQDPRLTEGVTISPVEVKRDGYLSTVETRNFDLAEIEMIYALDVIDVISQPDAFE